MSWSEISDSLKDPVVRAAAIGVAFTAAAGIFSLGKSVVRDYRNRYKAADEIIARMPMPKPFRILPFEEIVGPNFKLTKRRDSTPGASDSPR